MIFGLYRADYEESRRRIAGYVKESPVDFPIAKHEEVQWTSIAFCGADCEQSEAKRRIKNKE